MTVEIIGWVLIGLAAGLLGVLTFIFKWGRQYSVRELQMGQLFERSQEASIERGLRRQIVLGHQFWSYSYPSLGLWTVNVLPVLLKPEVGEDGLLSVSTADGTLAVMARQVVEQTYRNGFSTFLGHSGVQINLPGLTPLVFTAGFLSGIVRQPYGSLTLLGVYGPESLLWVDAVQSRDSVVMAAAGTLAAQAALYANVQNILIGESI
ncbi:MAG: hypothetical protein ACK2TV_03360, partial [Anaerolineales bacterium]